MGGTTCWRPGASALVALLTSASVGCSNPLGDKGESAHGLVTVRTVSEGGAFDMDGYAVVIDGDSVFQMDVTDTRTLAVEQGPHSVALTGVAPSCLAEGPHTISVAAGGTAEVDFLVSCTPPVGLSSVRILFVDATGIVAMNADGSDRTQLLSSPDVDAVDVSADGSRLAFVRRRGGEADLWVSRADGSDPYRLVRGRAPRDPRWSPTGSEIAYANHDEGGWGGLRVTSIEGGGTTPLTAVEHVVDSSPGWPSWSPNGTRVAFWDYGHVGIVNREDHQAVFLAPGSHPAWSPDDRIAYVVETEIRVIRPDGSGSRSLLRAPRATSPRVHAWSADGGLLLYTNTGVSGGTDVYLLDVPGQTSVRVTGNGTSSSPAFWPAAD